MDCLVWMPLIKITTARKLELPTQRPGNFLVVPSTSIQQTKLQVAEYYCQRWSGCPSQRLSAFTLASMPAGHWQAGVPELCLWLGQREILLVYMYNGSFYVVKRLFTYHFLLNFLIISCSIPAQVSSRLTHYVTNFSNSLSATNYHWQMEGILQCNLYQLSS